MRYFMATLAVKHISTEGESTIFKLIEALNNKEADQKVRKICTDIEDVGIHKVMFYEIRMADKNEISSFKNDRDFTSSKPYKEIRKEKIVKLKEKSKLDKQRKTK